MLSHDKMKVGVKIRCINGAHLSHNIRKYTLNKEYEVIEIDNKNYYIIICDDGSKRHIGCDSIAANDFFEHVETNEEPKNIDFLDLLKGY